MCHQNIPDWKINKLQHRSKDIYDQIYFLISWRACLFVQEARSLLKLKITFRTDSGMHCHQSFRCTQSSAKAQHDINFKVSKLTHP